LSERFYLSEPVRNGRAFLAGDEAKHLIKVMRAKIGDEILLFNGTGTEYVARIEAVQKDHVQLEILSSVFPETEPKTEITIAVSLPKGDRQKLMLEKLTEIGCKRVIPLKTERGIVSCDEKVCERLRRQVVEASKQSRRSTLMEVLPEMSLEQVAAWAEDGCHCYIAHPVVDGDFGQQPLSSLLDAGSKKDKFLILIGPVGGLTAEEVQRAIDLGFRPIDLGPRILKVETAAMIIAACLIYGCREYHVS